MPNSDTKSQHRLLYMLGLILAGEAVFALPFHLARFFRPIVLETFQISATELGAAQGVYGLLAMACYFLGGPVADRFEARKLLAVSLWSTAAGGLYLATFPGYIGAMLVWGFFGITTILLFWGALIKATRAWGGADQQGRAYGLLDGGRGVLAAGLASAGVYILAATFPENYEAATLAEKKAAMRTVIYGYTVVTAMIGAYVWIALPHPSRVQEQLEQSPPHESITRHLSDVARRPAVWLNAVIVLCAYVGYKGVDNYSLFAVQAYDIDEVEAAGIVTLAAWVRPIAAVGAGLLGDRFDVTRMLLLAFVLLLASDLLFALNTPVAGATGFLMANIVVACAAVFGLRGLYFALFERVSMPMAMTGSAVGIVSLIGFTPDVFVALVAGMLIDANPGALGHQHFFAFLAAFAGLGVAASLVLMRQVSGPRQVAA